ncbi:MAG: Flp pilus assembly complex ATPase component TadA [Anaerolineales bacterium]|nr:Flp pilus assembly complex ATPase component TadA [Anaerolineales bacterium]
MDKKARVLIVDDDVNLGETLADILEEKGYLVAVAHDGPGAIEEVKGQPFDLALIDIVMPGMNGVETLRQIKAINPRLTTMLITGHTALEDSVSEAVKAGVAGILYKPLDINAIVEMIESRAEATGLPRIDLKTHKVRPAALRLIPEAVARKWDIMPLRIEDDFLVVAMADPNNLYAIENIRALSRMEVRILPAALMDVRGAINLHYRAMGEIEKELRHILPTASERVQADERISSDLIAQAPIVRAVNLLVSQAVKDRASDIHVEPQQDRVRVRYRIDGILHETLSLPLSVHGPMISRVKVLAAMNIAERRRPQDGHFAVSVDGTDVDIRVATADTTWGEMAVLRVLDKAMSVMDLADLGFLPGSLQTYQRVIQSPFGMVLASGPTGSGKTTTLYASINQLDSKERNIITIEDPVEYRFANVNQMQVNLQANVTFAGGLRATMRLDPDVILVGEIRDKETASIAIQAALTGHLVLSTVHANDAVGALFRLMDLGIEPFLITSAMVGIIAQRLVRRVCPHCRTLREVTEEERLAYEMDMGEKRTKFYHGGGCNFCALTGYYGRMGVYEILVMSEEIRRLVLRGASTDEIKVQAVKEGMVTMWRDGMMKVKEGLTTPREIMRNVFVIG